MLHSSRIACRGRGNEVDFKPELIKDLEENLHEHFVLVGPKLCGTAVKLEGRGGQPHTTPPSINNT
jgi:hypothetical protein